MLLISLVLTFLVIYLAQKYFTRNFDYWRKKNVPYIKPEMFYGNFKKLCWFKATIGVQLADFYKEMANEPYFGIFVFNKPHLILRCPELVKQVLIRDFHNFDNRNTAYPKHDPMTASMLLFNRNPDWKNVRTKMNPVFSSGKLKVMFSSISKLAETMTKYIEKQNLHSSLEARELCSKYSTDVIAKCAFGIDANCFLNENAEFREISRLAFDFRLQTAVQQVSYFFLPQIVDLFRLNFVDTKVTTFLREIFWHTIKFRQEHKIKINDLIGAILEMIENEEFCKSNNFEGDKVLAQPLQFFLAGFETTGSTIAFTLYELCLHQEIQNKLREEILQSRNADGKFTYDAVQNMKYLHMCISETLRKHPPLPFLNRECREDYKISGTDVVIEKGTPVLIPMLGLHYDPEFFLNPDKYDPDRFSENNIKNIKSFTYLPFGQGPRICIGDRFGLLSSKLGVIHILSKFILEPSADTPVPLVISSRSFVLSSETGLPMTFRKIL